MTDARNLALAELERNRPVTGLVAFGPGANLEQTDGQSNGNASFSWPPLHSNPPPGVYMLGDDVHGIGAGADYRALGGANLRALKGGALSIVDITLSDGTPIPADTALTPAQLALAWPAQDFRGETIDVSSGYDFRRRARENGFGDDCVTIHGNTSHRGESLLSLLPGFIAQTAEGAVELYQRFPSWLAQVRAAVGPGTPVRFTVARNLGHESSIGGQTRLSYRSLLDAKYQAQLGAHGGDPHAFFIYPAAGAYARKPAGNGSYIDAALPMACVEYAQVNPYAFVVAAYHMYPQGYDGQHVSNEGYRLLGLKDAQVKEHVLLRRKNWPTFTVLEVEADGPVITVHLLVPFAPAKARPLPNGALLAGLGFNVEDAQGVVAVTAAEIIGATTVKLTCARTADPATGLLFYAWYDSDPAGVNRGVGNITDSDGDVSGPNWMIPGAWRLDFRHALVGADSVPVLVAGATVTNAQSPSIVASCEGTTYFDRSWTLNNDQWVMRVGVYCTNPGPATVKIARRNAANDWTVIISQNFNHPGGGWADHTLAAPFQIPPTGAYHVGAYINASTAVIFPSTARAHKAGNVPAGPVAPVPEDSNYMPAIRATYGIWT
jgi:hypothetical protein